MSGASQFDTDGLWILVLGYGNPRDSIECIRSIRATQPGPLNLAFLDNGSPEADFASVSREFPDITLLRFEKNGGVGRGFNGGWKWLLRKGARWILNVCNDVVFTPGVIGALAEEARKHPHTGMVVPKVVYNHDPTRIWSAGSRLRRFPPAIVHRKTTGPERGEFDRPEPIPYAAMCVNLLAADALKSAGLFNPQYRYTYEDVDLCLRMRRRGFGIRYAPGARVLHKSPVIGETPRSPEFWRIYGRSANLFKRHLGTDEPDLSGPLARLYLHARAGVEGGFAGWRNFARGWRDGEAEPLTPQPAWDSPEADDPLVVREGRPWQPGLARA